MDKLIALLGDPDVCKKDEDGVTVWKWIKGKDQQGQVLSFSVETCSSDSEYMYSYTEDDDTEICDYGDMEEILLYAKDFLKYVSQVNRSGIA